MATLMMKKSDFLRLIREKKIVILNINFILLSFDDLQGEL